MAKAYIIASVRTAVGRAYKGSLKDTRPDDLGAVAIRGALGRVPNLDPARIDDVILGCAMPEAEQGMNVARICALKAGVPDSVPAMTINRFCSSGLQAIAMAAERIFAGFADVVVAGGTESMTMVPMGGNKPSFNPELMENRPEVYLPMGLTAEEVARRYKVTREDQDQFAYHSHRKALAAIRDGKFREEIVPVSTVLFQQKDGEKLLRKEIVFDTDDGPRADTTVEALAKLKPAFQPDGGTVTAGNAPGITDGAAALVLASESAMNGSQPMARITGYAQGAVEPKRIFYAPVLAIRNLLAKTGTTLADYDLFEINEAFAAQVLADGKELGLDWSRVNVHGGAVALGHPIGASGARVLTTLLHAMRARRVRRGLATLCLGGGGAVSMLVERP